MNEDIKKTSDEISIQFKELADRMAREKNPSSPFSESLLVSIIDYLVMKHDVLTVEAESYMTLLSVGDKLCDMASHKNPLVRVKAARLKASPEVLANDSSSLVRVATLRHTGHYSEGYKANEDSPEMLKELVLQGVDPDFYASQGGILEEMVELQEQVDDLIYKVSLGDKEVYRKIGLEIAALIEADEYASQRGWFIKALEMLTIKYESRDVRKDYDPSNTEEAIKERAVITDKVLNSLVVGEETPLGVVIEIGDNIKVHDYNDVIVEHCPTAFDNYIEHKLGKLSTRSDHGRK